jgi:hypothetical protein
MAARGGYLPDRFLRKVRKKQTFTGAGFCPPSDLLTFAGENLVSAFRKQRGAFVKRNKHWSVPLPAVYPELPSGSPTASGTRNWTYQNDQQAQKRHVRAEKEAPSSVASLPSKGEFQDGMRDELTGGYKGHATIDVGARLAKPPNCCCD